MVVGAEVIDPVFKEVIDPDTAPVDVAEDRELVKLTDPVAVLFTPGRIVLKFRLVI